MVKHTITFIQYQMLNFIYYEQQTIKEWYGGLIVSHETIETIYPQNLNTAAFRNEFFLSR